MANLVFILWNYRINNVIGSLVMATNPLNHSLICLLHVYKQMQVIW